ncbi:MAG: sigma-54 dependent transcriptional regulator [Candidatus Marinimicrobia bacterium]|nr:sigma-54 dependent transcriptional regulator [Candidatus Neomarinimicrobiota bacterium]MCF7880492.1 sigma-54 dependent transcriptional regulator [Candidatus Neomarinimicrobiota bacterium]
MENQDFSVLVVDDEPYMVNFLQQALTKKDYKVKGVTSGPDALEYLLSNSIDLILTDYKMPEMLGIELLEKVKTKSPDIGVIMMTAYGTIESAVKALKLGAADYITKPFSVDDIYQVIQNFFESAEQKEKNISVRGEDRFGELIGKSPQMQKIYRTISLVSNSRASVFIQGPRGTGKELVARAIHYNSDRADKPFIRVNCAALPESLMESELFGHEKGAFTGAIRKNVGKFELADTGTLLLDEITEMDIGLQAKLLRAIQEKEFHRVGGDEEIKVDVRILATSNRDLQQAIEEGHLREDLYYRLNTIPIVLPPLSERREDIEPLVYHFIDKFTEEYGSEVEDIEDNAIRRLLQEEFPGNVRELENRILRATILSQSKLLTEDVLFIEDQETDAELHGVVNFGNPVTIEEMERDLILQTLEYHDYSRTKSAESLGINVRTLRNKINQYKEDGIISDSFFSD